MKNMDSKKLILIGVLLASLIALILLWPFGMQVVKDGSSFQSISKVHGENLTLTGAMRRLGTAGEKMGQWQLIETSSEYAVLRHGIPKRLHLVHRAAGFVLHFADRSAGKRGAAEKDEAAAFDPGRAGHGIPLLLDDRLVL